MALVKTALILDSCGDEVSQPAKRYEIERCVDDLLRRAEAPKP